MATTTSKYMVQGMSCGNCSSRVQRAILEIPGVAAARVSHETGVAEVDAESSVAPATIVETIEKKGYKAASAN